MHNSQDSNLDKDIENSINLDKNWKACEELVRKKIKFNKIKNILLINPPQFQTSHINLEMLKNVQKCSRNLFKIWEILSFF